MTFAEEYKNAVTIRQLPHTEYPRAIPAESFAGTFYELSDKTNHRLPTILSGGSGEFSSNCALRARPMDCRLLLFTKEGAGVLTRQKKTYSLEKGSLLYLDCSLCAFALTPAQLPWRFTVFMLQKDALACYEEIFPSEPPLVYSPSPHSPILSGLELLLSGGSENLMYNKLADARILTDILTSLFSDAFHLEAPDIPCAPYLLEIKRYLDTCFMNPLRLDELEVRHHMSKYRICHEFSDTFGEPPLKYLNNRRLEAAANLLLATDKHINEIALEVGFENTSHFISLFKKRNGVTPLVYRTQNGRQTKDGT